jgi:hypothetical protein
MGEGIGMHLALLNIIVVEFDFADAILVILVDCQKVVIHQSISYPAELSIIVHLGLHVLNAEVDQVL